MINRCARLLDIANGGQVLVTGTTAALVTSGDELADGLSLRDLGQHWLRDVAEPITAWQVVGDGLRSSFPPLPSLDPAALPRLRGELLGRVELVAAVAEQIADESLVTLLGPGGIGKTSLALAVAWHAVDARPVTFVDLARVSDPDAVADRLADAVAGPDHEQGTVRAPADRLAERLAGATDLVVVDNAEHVLDAVAAVVDQVLGHQLKGSFLVTSRQPLGLADEVIVGVPPLGVPADDADLADTGRAPSVQLFVDRARAIRPDINLPDGLLPVVAHICRRLDGIPLAIELAAGRASLLSVDDIAARLDDQLRLLRQVRSQRERRHRSLEAVVSWSVDQLSDDAYEVFQRLSVMAGSFGLDGAERILDLCGLASVEVLEALDELHGASLVTVEPDGSRFRMLEPIRQFAAARLAERDATADTRRAHARWAVALVVAAHACRDETRGAALAAIDAEADQLLAALGWMVESGDVELAGEVAFPVGWWFLTRDPTAGARTLGQLLAGVDRDDTPLTWANLVLGLAVATAAHPRSDVADRSLEALDIFDEHQHPERALARIAAVFAQTVGNDDLALPARLLAEADADVPADDRWGRAVVDMAVMTIRGLLRSLGGEIDAVEAVERGERAARTFRELGESWALGATLGELGRLHLLLDDSGRAEACFVEAMEHLGSGDHGSHFVLTELGRMATGRGDHDRARRYHAEALRVAELDGSDGCIALTLAGMAHGAEGRGDTDEAIDLYRRALDLAGDSLIELAQSEWVAALDRLDAARADD